MQDKLKAYNEAYFLKELREGSDDSSGEEGEGQFGFVPLSPDPNSMLNRPTHSSELGMMGDGPKPHPLLSKTQQFSGMDPKLTANPTENQAAQENYPQLKMKNQLRLNQSKRKGAPAPTPR